jgi:predicted homoserine dehydrogenase-like protein
LLPIGFAEHATLRKRITRDEPIALDDVELDERADR